MFAKGSSHDMNPPTCCLPLCIMNGKRARRGHPDTLKQNDFGSRNEAWVTYWLLRFEPGAGFLRSDSEHRH